MKINLGTDSLSTADEQKIIYNLIKTFCDEHKISAKAIPHLIDKFDAVAKWAKDEKNLKITKKHIGSSYGVVFDIDETAELTALLLKTI